MELCEEITRECEVEMSLEGIYRWIVFLPSKEKESRPVPARYYGVFTDGRMKVRGLACRRSDTPEFVRELQLEMLAVLAKARTLAEKEEAEEKATLIFAERIERLE
jgi:DNA polymerase-2